MKPIFILFLLLLPCQIIAQDSTQEPMPNVWIEGDVHNSTIIGKYFKTEIVNNITVIQIDSIAIRNIARSEMQPVLNAFAEGISKNRSDIERLKQNDDENAVRITALETRLSMLTDALSEVQRREDELIAKKWNYLPLGVHQFTHKEIGKGILFAGVEAGLLGAGIGYRISSKHNLEKHKDNSYDPWERDRFYDNAKASRCISACFCIPTRYPL